jgi:hypothetical protein
VALCATADEVAELVNLADLELVDDRDVVTLRSA